MKLNLPKDTTFRYVLAFSGGADSALLAYLLKQQGYNFRLAHVVHPDSKASKDGETIRIFCEHWAKTYEVPITCLRISLDQNLVKDKGTEAAERQARYEALENELHSGEALLTAHHLDDSVETFLFRVARGTSVKGLRGILENPGKTPLFRPLLSISKSEIQQLVQSAAILYGHDSTNDNTELSRGFIRNKIVPLFVEHFSANKFYASMKRNMENMSECSELLEDLFNMDTQICGKNETGVLRKAFLSLSETRQRNFLHHLIYHSTGQILSKNQIEEIRKRLNTDRNVLEFSVNRVTVLLQKEYFCVRNEPFDVNTVWKKK